MRVEGLGLSVKESLQLPAKLVAQFYRSGDCCGIHTYLQPLAYSVTYRRCELDWIRAEPIRISRRVPEIGSA